MSKQPPDFSLRLIARQFAEVAKRFDKLAELIGSERFSDEEYHAAFQAGSLLLAAHQRGLSIPGLKEALDWYDSLEGQPPQKTGKASPAKSPGNLFFHWAGGSRVWFKVSSEGEVEVVGNTYCPSPVGEAIPPVLIGDHVGRVRQYASLCRWLAEVVKTHHQPTPTKEKKRRGRKADRTQVEHEADILFEWESFCQRKRGRGERPTKKDFSRRIGLKPKEVEAIIKRAKTRESRSLSE